MKSFSSESIVLRRVNYGEADRVVTLLSRSNGQVAAIAKGVRKPKSRLAGGLELLSINDITLIETRGDLDIVRSARGKKHFTNIITDYERMVLAYDIIAKMYRVTQDHFEEPLFDLLADALDELDNLKLDLVLIEAWFWLNLLTKLGQQPALDVDAIGEKLQPDSKYVFMSSEGGFGKDGDGKYDQNHIKAWRLLSAYKPSRLPVKGLDEAVQQSIGDLRRFSLEVLPI